MTSLIKELEAVNPEKTRDFIFHKIKTHADEPLTITGKLAAVDDNKKLRALVRTRFVADEGREDLLNQDDEKQTDRMGILVRELYPDAVFTSWNMVNPETKEPEPYTPNACKEVMKHVSIYDVAALMGFFSNPNNFTELSIKDGELVGNASGTE